ncbi:hypothetical protein B9Z55_003416 [Caenorhabditis nigoni]|uniref:BTB domain-containing protein n=1 Tax=Caenorhabditis nigoni TaxID=1611254 RepID=A0A2G5VQ49_9PELO|nr:hypothetical protein B9Z55_003416 [Caenorhabditis nigoni]
MFSFISQLATTHSVHAFKCFPVLLGALRLATRLMFWHGAKSLNSRMSEEAVPAKKRRGNGPDELPDLREFIETNVSEIKRMVNNQEKKILDKMEKLETQINAENEKSLDKKFEFNETFCDILTMKEGDYRDGKPNEHFGQDWSIVIKRQNDYLGVYLKINEDENFEKWSADTFHSLEISVDQEYCEIMRMKGNFQGGNIFGTREFCTWQEMQERWLVDGKLSVKAEVHIKKMAGIIKPKLIDFDASAKFSDYVLEAGGQKFHVLKQLLAMRSPYFEALFYGKFTESTKDATELKNVDPTDFQNFLEVLHGEYKAIDDFTLEGIMLLNDVYDARTVGERCQEFLMEKSQLSLVKKLKLISKYKNEELKEKLISEIKTLEEYKSIVADGLEDFSLDVTKALLRKSLTLQ